MCNTEERGYIGGVNEFVMTRNGGRFGIGGSSEVATTGNEGIGGAVRSYNDKERGYCNGANEFGNAEELGGIVGANEFAI